MSFYAKMRNLSTFWGILGLKQGVVGLISIYDTDIEIVIRSDKYRLWCIKPPGVKTASEFRNTREIVSQLNAWIKSA